MSLAMTVTVGRPDLPFCMTPSSIQTVSTWQLRFDQNPHVLRKNNTSTKKSVRFSCCLLLCKCMLPSERVELGG
eukprot:1231723-Amphidinium_carterae.1